ncbi:MAG TPA: bifunctional 4-hydroxy-2-oxoglutarate aldolase/2-dehydro-3-deoxy-phosphogluconate aldolase, partial [Phycisphaeraceae bacterium]
MAVLERTRILQRIEEAGLIAVIRSDSARQAVDTCKALRDGGVTILEVALTTPGGVHAIEQLVEELDDCLIGAGTVMSVAAVHDVAKAGAAFVFAPNVNLDV